MRRFYVHVGTRYDNDRILSCHQRTDNEATNRPRFIYNYWSNSGCRLSCQRVADVDFITKKVLFHRSTKFIFPHRTNEALTINLSNEELPWLTTDRGAPKREDITAWLAPFPPKPWNLNQPANISNENLLVSVSKHCLPWSRENIDIRDQIHVSTPNDNDWSLRELCLWEERGSVVIRNWLLHAQSSRL